MADEYNIDSYFPEIHYPERAAFPSLPVRVGTPAPPFTMPLVDGGTISLTDLLAKGHVVLILGCYTAPPLLAQLPALEAMHRTYGGRGISFLLVYTREIHPGENLPPHRTMDQKLDHARQMRDYSRISIPIAVDDLQGSLHIALGNLPSMAIVIHRDGTLVYRGSWTLAGVIQMVLEDLLRRDRAEQAGERGRFAYHEWTAFMEVEPPEVWDLLDLAGPKARAEKEVAPQERSSLGG